MPATKEQTDEHPIIFSGWSIRRILADEKSETRRIVKPQPDHVLHEGKTAVVESPIEVVEDGHLVEKTHADNGSVFVDEIKCPYGNPGDRLWVREAFRLPEAYDDMSPREYIDKIGHHSDRPSRPVRYEADGGGTIKWALPKGGIVEWGRKRPSIHMPRELCRLRLRVENVRVERLQEISAEEVQSEGVTRDDEFLLRYDSRHLSAGEIYRRAFKHLWNEIHGDGAWEENPHVWVVEFSKIDAE